MKDNKTNYRIKRSRSTHKEKRSHEMVRANKNTQLHCDPVPDLVPLVWHDEARAALDAADPPVLVLVGPPGTGKTEFARNEALRRTGSLPLTHTGTPETEQMHLFGRVTLDGDRTPVVDSIIPVAIKTQSFAVIEEFALIPLEVRAALLEVDQRQITNPVSQELLKIPAGGNFRLVCTSNEETFTACRRNSGLANVIYDRCYIVETTAIDEIQAARFLRNKFPRVDQAHIERAIRLWSDYREISAKGSSGKDYLSYRAAEKLLRLLLGGLPEIRAVQVALVNKLKPSDQDLFQAASLRNSISDADVCEDD